MPGSNFSRGPTQWGHAIDFVGYETVPGAASPSGVLSPAAEPYDISDGKAVLSPLWLYKHLSQYPDDQRVTGTRVIYRSRVSTRVRFIPYACLIEFFAGDEWSIASVSAAGIYVEYRENHTRPCSRVDTIVVKYPSGWGFTRGTTIGDMKSRIVELAGGSL